MDIKGITGISQEGLEQSIRDYIRQHFGEFELSEDMVGDEEEEEDTRTWEQVKEDIEKHRLVLSLGWNFCGKIEIDNSYGYD